MKIAIVHEMLIKLGGAEKVVESLLRLYPDAELFTLIYDEKKVGKVFPKNMIQEQCKKLSTQRLYQLTSRQRLCLPLMAQSIESLDFSKYDVVLVSSSGFAHGIITKPETKTIIYYHAPARYMWDWTHENTKDLGLNQGIKGYFFGKFLLKLRQWDYIAAQRNDIILANSNNTKGRVKKYFRRQAQVLYPPVETERFAKKVPATNEQNYYIIISALTEFKKLDIAIQAFHNISNTRLIIIGDGNHRESLERIASKNTTFVGAQFGDDLVSLVQGSLGLIFPGEEDFGIVPIEVMAAGKPVFALQKGGLTETILPGSTGEFFKDPEGSDFIENFYSFHSGNLEKKYSPDVCIKQAQNFSESLFHKRLQQTIKKEVL